MSHVDDTRLLLLVVLSSALTGSACAKDDPSTGAATASTTQAVDGGDSGDSETTAGDGDGDGGTDTAPFVPQADVTTDSTCDPWLQDCPEGDKCVAFASTGENWDANKCVPVSGSGQHGDPCMFADAQQTVDDCGPDSFCWNVNLDGVGSCTPFCRGTSDEPICGGDDSCIIANEGSINLCLQRCDPLLQDCDGENVCFYDFGGHFVCTFASDGIPTGSPCGFINDCAAGNVCLDAVNLPLCADASCCAAFCDLANPSCAVFGTECSAFFGEDTAPPGYENIGVCIIPGA